jgi:hypothetical protein
MVHIKIKVMPIWKFTKAKKKHRNGWLNAISNVDATTHLGRAII